MKPLFYLIPALLLAALVYSLVPQEQQPELSFGADSGFLSPDSGTNDASIGTTAWTLPENATASDNVRASNATGVSNCSNTVTDVRLYVGGSITGDDKSAAQAFNTLDTTVVVGGASDLWGVALTPDDVNAIDFGYAVSLTGQTATSNYVVASDYDLAIPTDATINGIEVSFEGGCSSATARMDYMSLKVYYTEAAPSAVAATGNLRTSSVQIRTGSVNFR